MRFPVLPDAARRFGFFLPNLDGGGAERMILALANGFGEAGFQTDMILMSATGDYLEDIGPSVRLVDLGSRRAMCSVLPLRRHIQDEGIDVLISGLDHANLCASAAVRLARHRTRLLLSQRNTLTFTSYGQSKLMNWLVRQALKSADRVLAVSEGVRQDLLQNHGLSPDHVKTAHNPVVSQVIFDKAGQKPIGVSGLSNRKFILASGRLEVQKGFDILIHAYSRIALSCPDIDLVILGRGGQLDDLKSQAESAGISGRVHFPGFVQNPFALMRSAEVFVLSSRFEGLPGVLIQAMACGTKVVATDCPSGPREILEDGRYGTLVPVDDPTALARAIHETIHQPMLPDLRTRACQYSVETAVRRHIELAFKELA